MKAIIGGRSAAVPQLAVLEQDAQHLRVYFASRRIQFLDSVRKHVRCCYSEHWQRLCTQAAQPIMELVEVRCHVGGTRPRLLSGPPEHQPRRAWL